jgi:hypothetical protein
MATPRFDRMIAIQPSPHFGQFGRGGAPPCRFRSDRPAIGWRRHRGFSMFPIMIPSPPDRPASLPA